MCGNGAKNSSRSVRKRVCVRCTCVYEASEEQGQNKKTYAKERNICHAHQPTFDVRILPDVPRHGARGAC
jgi:hypothetical protein